MAHARVTLMALVAASVAHAEPVPDATLRAVQDSSVRLELDGAPAVEGRLLRFEAASITLAVAPTNEVVTVPRERVARVIALGATPERLRVLGLHSSLLGTVAIDAEYGRLRAFASTNLVLPVLTASGDGTYVVAAAGAGLALPLRGSRWKLDVFGTVLPFHATSFYTYLGFGIGAGFHYTSRSGLSIGFTFPVIGFATRLGSSPHGYDPSFRYNDSLGYYYFAALAGMPLFTLGYRFATRCPAR